MRAVSPKQCWLNACPADELRKPIYNMVFAAMHPPNFYQFRARIMLGG